jgi:hypothetical protein
LPNYELSFAFSFRPVSSNAVVRWLSGTGQYTVSVAAVEVGHNSGGGSTVEIVGVAKFTIVPSVVSTDHSVAAPSRSRNDVRMRRNASMLQRQAVMLETTEILRSAVNKSNVIFESGVKRQSQNATTLGRCNVAVWQASVAVLGTLLLLALSSVGSLLLWTGGWCSPLQRRLKTQSTRSKTPHADGARSFHTDLELMKASGAIAAEDEVKSTPRTWPPSLVMYYMQQT